jgi:transposase
MKQRQFSTIIGVDLGDKKHHVCVIGKDGEILVEQVIANTPSQLQQLAAQYPGALVAIEVGGHSPWVSRLLEEHGCRCVVANARKLRAIYTNERKCDRVDARMLAKLARADVGLLSPIQHGSLEHQQHRLVITMRDSLVRQRVDMISSIRFSLKSLGVRLPGCSTPSFCSKCRQQLQGQEILSSIEPILKVLDELNQRVRELTQQIIQTAEEHHPATKLLEQIPGVGPVTSLSFVLTIGNPGRFEDPRDVAAYLGLVPRREQSGDMDKQLPISKTGNREMRRLLVQCAQYILGHFGPDCDLRRHGLQLAARGGKSAKRKAVIAIARKLAVLMLVLWKTNSDYEPLRQSKPMAA